MTYIIDWDHVREDFNWLWIDPEGEGYLFNEEPYWTGAEYLCRGDQVSADAFASLDIEHVEYPVLITRPAEGG